MTVFQGGKENEKLVTLNKIKYFWAVFQIDWVSKLMFRVFILKNYLQKYVNIFECIENYETIYESVVKTSYKILLEQIPTVL